MMRPSILISFPKIYIWRIEVSSFMNGQSNFQKNFGSRINNKFTFHNQHKKSTENTNLRVNKPEFKSTSITSSRLKLKPIYSPSNKEIIFGIHPVHLALLQQKRTLNTLFLRDDSALETSYLNQLRKKKIEDLAIQIGVPVRKVTSATMKHLVPNVVHQGVCLSTGLLPLPEWQENGTEETLDRTNLPLWLVLDELLDPMNVGAIVRSAHYFGVDKLFVVKGNSCKLSPIVSKASSGALEIIDIYQIEELQKFVQIQKELGWEIISTMAYCESSKTLPHLIVDAANIKISKPIILILGNEGKGVSVEIQNLCDKFISIYPPKELHHGIDSLNVSVATGVILHALTSQKQHNIS